MDANEPLPVEDRTLPIDTTLPMVLSSRSLLAGVLADIARRHEICNAKGWNGGIRCGFPIIDRDLRGLRPGSVTILNAAPNIGKTTLTNQIAYQVAAFPGQKCGTFYLTFENAVDDLLLKQLSRLSGFCQNDIEAGEVHPAAMELQGAARTLAGLPMYFMAGNSSTLGGQIIERVREVQADVKANFGEGYDLLLCIDYLQYFARFFSKANANEQTGAALAQLREVATQTKAALFVIGSQNRLANTSGDTSMHSGKNSGDIEYDADQMFSLALEDGTAIEKGKPSSLVLRAVKTRFGGAGAYCYFSFNRERALFEVKEKNK